VRAEQVVELLDLVLLRDVGELLQKAFEVTTEKESKAATTAL